MPDVAEAPIHEESILASVHVIDSNVRDRFCVQVAIA